MQRRGHHEMVPGPRDMSTWTDRLVHSKLRTFVDAEGHFWLEQNSAKVSKRLSWPARPRYRMGVCEPCHRGRRKKTPLYYRYINYGIRKVSTNGIITNVAGSGLLSTFLVMEALQLQPL
jgi:hypothetical protein